MSCARARSTYDLLAERDARGQDDTYLLRVEQLYPIPGRSLRTELERFLKAEWVWCQEEPKNQGAWFHMSNRNSKAMLVEHRRQTHPPPLCRRSQVASASPATGLASRHKYEQETLVKEALG